MRVELVADGRAVTTLVLVAAAVGGGAYALGRSGKSAEAPAEPAPAATSAAPAPSPSPTPPPSGKLVFADEFDGSQLDRSRWIDSFPHDKRTHSNGERQYYAPDGYKVAGGKLIFTAQRRSMGGMEYTSGMVSSFGHFAQRYGRFEIRARFPKGKGLWPAFWLLPENETWPPEIDILEVLGHEPNNTYYSNHFVAGNQHKWETVKHVGPDWSADFHTYALEWKPGKLTWFMDGKVTATTTQNVPDRPMYILTNLAVGGEWPGYPDSKTPFPSSMEIDYIRAWAP